MLQELSVKNYRNLSIPRLKISTGTTILVGSNGQGKTNILEAIYFLSYGKPFRGSKSDCIQWGGDEALISGSVDNQDLRVLIKKDQETTISINGKKRSIVDLFGKFVSVLFHPEEIEMVTGAPTLRRNWLNRSISTVNKHYLFDLIKYQKILKNRNKLLKQRVHTKEEVDIWDKSLVKYGARIWRERASTIIELNKLLGGRSKKITGKVLRIMYSNPLTRIEERDQEKYYLKSLKSYRSLEERMKATVYGPHRDDFHLITEEQSGQSISQKDTAAFGSRGEQRQAVILLKLTEAAYFTKAFSKPPTILLDDVVSELDEKNRNLLLTNVFGKQVIITTTDVENFSSEVKVKSRVLKVENGRVSLY